jgi:hypothetical protein
LNRGFRRTLEQGFHLQQFGSSYLTKFSSSRAQYLSEMDRSHLIGVKASSPGALLHY